MNIKRSDLKKVVRQVDIHIRSSYNQTLLVFNAVHIGWLDMPSICTVRMYSVEHRTVMRLSPLAIHTHFMQFFFLLSGRPSFYFFNCCLRQHLRHFTVFNNCEEQFLRVQADINLIFFTRVCVSAWTWDGLITFLMLQQKI